MPTMNPTVEQYANNQHQTINELAEAVSTLKVTNHPASDRVQQIINKFRSDLNALATTNGQQKDHDR